ncbi:transcriptional regulator [Bacillus sp. LL01]|uniref:GyrI-like domain-containing protein n=1 Tax=Bacillus sp. LL01 TaxID=1665556 RepID=UPI00064D2DCE|nr:GyrI-like domain-containing protein [Bacillus sp. LL01]KMJ59405.1 transcriptional regulator [Bacillus sp. LL01]
MKTVVGELVNLPAYRAVGLKWEGPYSEVPTLKEVIQHMSTRVIELPHTKDLDMQLGLSYHLRPDGFVHFSVYEVEEEQEVPEGMLEIIVPAMLYLKVDHPKGKDIGATYTEIYKWFKNNEYQPLRETGVEYYDDLPIKHERYPRGRDLNDPHFEILIPVVKATPKVNEKRCQ